MEDKLSYLLRTISMKYRHYTYKILGKDRWGVSQDLAIYHIAQQKELNQKDLVQKLNITPASVSNIVGQMESRELLVRVQDEKDKRKSILSLTEKGQNIVPLVIDNWTKIQDETIKGFTESEKATFLRLLKHLEKNLDRLNKQFL
ncbi:MAG: MarR family transcriptional regulator [Candidatus Bathyarchaeota archaeon]